MFWHISTLLVLSFVFSNTALPMSLFERFQSVNETDPAGGNGTTFDCANERGLLCKQTVRMVSGELSSEEPEIPEDSCKAINACSSEELACSKLVDSKLKKVTDYCSPTDPPAGPTPAPGITSSEPSIPDDSSSTAFPAPTTVSTPTDATPADSTPFNFPSPTPEPTTAAPQTSSSEATVPEAPIPSSTVAPTPASSSQLPSTGPEVTTTSPQPEIQTTTTTIPPPTESITQSIKPIFITTSPILTSTYYSPSCKEIILSEDLYNVANIINIAFQMESYPGYAWDTCQYLNAKIPMETAFEFIAENCSVEEAQRLRQKANETRARLGCDQVEGAKNIHY